MQVHQAMVKEGQSEHRMAYSQRDIEYLEKNGWKKLEIQEQIPEQKKRKTLKLKKNLDQICTTE